MDFGKNSSEKNPRKADENPSTVNLEHIKKRLESEEASLDGLKNPRLTKNKKKLEETHKKLSGGNPEDIDIANLNDEVTKFIGDVSLERKLKNTNDIKRVPTGDLNEDQDNEKVEIPLFRIHNSIINSDSPHPFITYYRVNGNPGRLEESFKIISGTNRTSVYGIGATYEDY